MRTHDEIAQAVIFAEKVKQQRRNYASKLHSKFIAKGYKKVQAYVPTSLIPEVTKIIKDIVSTYEKGLFQ